MNIYIVLINNAGVSMRSTLVDFDVKDSVDLLQIDLVSPVIITNLVLTDIVKNNKNKDNFGHIVNINSIAGRLQVPFRSAYCASKSGLLGFGYSISSEVNDYDNITITEILPGPVATDVDIAAKGKGGIDHKKRDDGIQNGMTTERCAELICIAISNKLRESWPVKGPALNIMYMAYYLPSLYDKFGRKPIADSLAIAAGYKKPASKL